MYDKSTKLTNNKIMKTLYKHSGNYKKGDCVVFEDNTWTYSPKKASAISTGKEPSESSEWVKRKPKKL